MILTTATVMDDLHNGNKLEIWAETSSADQLLDAMDDQEDTQEIIDQKLINEEYKIWKKNTPFLYDMLWA